MTWDDTIRQLVDLNNAFADPFASSEIIYHYTSADGFRGIVGDNELWLTNTAFVNDTTECRAFWELGKGDVFGADSLPNKYVVERWERAKEMGVEDNNYYIASFSKAGDQLQQFRAYGNFCIGFRASGLVKAEFHLYDCVYDVSEVRKWIREKSTIKEWNGDCLDDQTKRASAYGLLFAASMKYKNVHYDTEQEVRLIAESNHDLRRWPKSFEPSEKEPSIHFRDHPAYRIPVPYVKFFVSTGRRNNDTLRREDAPTETVSQMKRRRLREEERESRELLPITRVSIGPMTRRDEAKLACEIMLQEKGYENVRVDVPEIPYRGV